jgi:hypothetical protein
VHFRFRFTAKVLGRALLLAALLDKEELPDRTLNLERPEGSELVEIAQ